MCLHKHLPTYIPKRLCAARQTDTPSLMQGQVRRKAVNKLCTADRRTSQSQMQRAPLGTPQKSNQQEHILVPVRTPKTACTAISCVSAAGRRTSQSQMQRASLGKQPTASNFASCAHTKNYGCVCTRHLPTYMPKCLCTAVAHNAPKPNAAAAAASDTTRQRQMQRKPLESAVAQLTDAQTSHKAFLGLRKPEESNPQIWIMFPVVAHTKQHRVPVHSRQSASQSQSQIRDPSGHSPPRTDLAAWTHTKTTDVCLCASFPGTERLGNADGKTRPKPKQRGTPRKQSTGAHHAPYQPTRPTENSCSCLVPVHSVHYPHDGPHNRPRTF
jgi:hypothetical protein